MKILAIEFSSAQRSVAVLNGGQEFEVVANARETSALGMIDDALRSAKLEREQIECLVIGIGPGSYNGIRGAISLAQGWQLAREIKLLGVSSVECLAAQAQAEASVWSSAFRRQAADHPDRLKAGHQTVRVNVVIDAQRNEFYLATYEISDKHRKEVESLRIVPFEKLQTLAQSGEIVIGPEVQRWLPAGKNLFPRAAMLGKLAANRDDFVAGEKLEPIYLRETNFVKAPPPRIIL